MLDTDITALSRRAEHAATEYLVTRYGGPGNPMRTEILRLGEATATKVPFVPSADIMNTVHGLRDPAALPELLAFYAQTEQPCWVSVTATRGSEALLAALVEHGFVPTAHSAVLASSAWCADAATVDGVEVRAVAKAQLTTFLEVLGRGFGTPESVLAATIDNQSFWGEVPQWRLLLACVHGEPAGAAVVAIDEGVAYLAAGSTLPAYRGQGVHGALIAARLRIAADEGCELVTGQAAFGSSSHRNQQRAGLRLIDVRQTWAHPGVAGTASAR